MWHDKRRGGEKVLFMAQKYHLHCPLILAPMLDGAIILYTYLISPLATVWFSAHVGCAEYIGRSAIDSTSRKAGRQAARTVTTAVFHATGSSNWANPLKN